MTAVLVGMVVALDLLWSLLVGSTGSFGYGFLDVPAHVATCAVALFAVSALANVRLRAPFVAAALAASVAIDIDHLPGYLGWHGLAGSLPRPYSHSLALVAALLVCVWATRGGTARQVSLGLAFGVSAHLLRDLATGPGVPLIWPVSSEVIVAPYALFAGGLAAAALVVAARSVSARRLGLVGAILVAMAVGLVSQPRSAEAASTVSLGAYIHGSQENPSLIDEYGTEVGQEPVIVSAYSDWTMSLIDRPWLESIWNRGAVPLLTWEPWSWNDPAQRFPLKAIAKGRYDDYIRSAAGAAAAWGEPILLRFGQEMNGAWYPWGKGHPARAYKQAWRHIVSVFRALGANNVRWVWSPYVSNGGHLLFERYFPGDRWVDWVGLDGFNWGSSRAWQSFGKIFGNSYRTLCRMTDRPMMIPETGSTEEGGDKAAWVLNALGRALPRFPRIRALVWFNDRFHSVESKIDSSEAALDALRTAVTSPRYQANRELLLSTPRSIR
ncbi:MAG TPA: glycosyl hydrolase [Solirubrobacterales bacterium]|nr:glycosyl hydrolase [Solirubrobacterales bacterium]